MCANGFRVWEYFPSPFYVRIVCVFKTASSPAFPSHPAACPVIRGVLFLFIPTKEKGKISQLNIPNKFRMAKHICVKNQLSFNLINLNCKTSVGMRRADFRR